MMCRSSEYHFTRNVSQASPSSGPERVGVDPYNIGGGTNMTNVSKICMTGRQAR